MKSNSENVSSAICNTKPVGFNAETSHYISIKTARPTKSCTWGTINLQETNKFAPSCVFRSHLSSYLMVHREFTKSFYI